MNDFVIYTDSACDISPELLCEWGVGRLPLVVRFTDSEEEFFDGELEITDFYNQMRSGRVAKTSAVNATTFENSFEEVLKEGKDILYIAFSSGLSTTYNSSRIASDTLKEKYPESKIVLVDTLAASAGHGLLVYLAKKKKDEGASIEEVAEYIENIKLNLSHWFTVDDLVYLKRGGRISPLAASFGNLIGIKPVLHVDNEGHLVSVSKVRGRKSSIMALADKYGELAVDKDGTVFISHADCMADVEFLKTTLETKYGAKVELITNVGSVIGAHSGPGTLAFFFIAKER